MEGAAPTPSARHYALLRRPPALRFRREPTLHQDSLLRMGKRRDMVLEEEILKQRTENRRGDKFPPGDVAWVIDDSQDHKPWMVCRRVPDRTRDRVVRQIRPGPGHVCSSGLGGNIVALDESLGRLPSDGRLNQHAGKGPSGAR